MIWNLLFIAFAWSAYLPLHKWLREYNIVNAMIAVIVLFIVYFGISAVFAYIDVTKRPYWLYRRKYQKDACVLKDEYERAFQRTATKFVVILIPFLLLVFAAMHWRVATFPCFDTNRFGGFLIALIIVYLIADFSAWGIHKILHKGILWDHIHSVHHQYVATVAVASLDAHPIEMIFWDALPFTLGPLLLGLNPAFFLIFGVLSLMNTILCHCGYDVGYDAGHHDLHHERLKCNYSGFLSDWLLGTLEKREKEKVYPRYDGFQKDLWGSRNEWCDAHQGYHRV